ncbi:MAG TPA: stalk domain-containing protein [Abditibacteriaceae bacterium]|jgi:LysM repeat protein
MNHVSSADSVLNRAARRRQMREQSLRLGVAGLAAGAVCASSASAAPAARLADANTYKRAETGPRVQLLQPGYNATLRGTEVPIVVSIQGRKFAPKSLELYVDGLNASNGALALDSSPTVELKWDTTLFKDGVHRLTVRVTDVQGFIGQAETQVYINNKGQADTTAPVLSWLNVHEKDVLKGVIDIQLKASDNFGVKYIFVSVNPAITPTRKAPLRQWLVNRPPYSFNFDTTKIPDGVYVLDALAWDALENEGHAPTRTFGVLNNSMNATSLNDLDKFSAARRFTDPEPVAPEVQPDVPVRSGGTTGQAGQRPTGGNRNKPQNPQPGRNIPVNPTATGAEHDPVRIAENTDIRSGSEGRVLPSFPSADSMTTLGISGEGATSRGVSRNATPRVQRSEPRFAEALPETQSRPRRQNGTTTNRVATSVEQGGVNSVEASDAQLSIVAPRLNGTLSTVDSSRTTIARAETPMRLTAPRLAANANPAPVVQERESVSLGASPQVSVVSQIIGSSIATRMARALESETVYQSRSTAPTSELRGASFPTTEALASAANLAVGSEVALSVSNAGLNTAVTHRAAPRLAASNMMRDAVKLDSFARSTNTAPQTAQSASGRATLPTANAPVLPQFPSLAALPKQAVPQTSRDVSNAITLAPMAGARKLPVSFVANSDTFLSAIAAKHGVSTEILAAVNNLKPNAKIARGQKVLFPREISLRYAGKPVSGDVSALQVGTTSVAAFRFLFEQNGGTMKWDAVRRQVVARDADGQREITLTIGSKNATVNEKEVAMDMAAFLLSGRTMVPVRFFEKALAARVEWEPATGRLLVSVSNTPTQG